MGADAPIPPRARSAAAPDGAPPRRIRLLFSRKGRRDAYSPLPRRDPMRRRADSLPQQGGGGIVIRFFGCSRDLSHAMKRKIERMPGYTWLCTSIHRPDRGADEDKIVRKNLTWKIV